MATYGPQQWFGPIIVREGWEFFQGKSSDLLSKTQSSLNAIANPILNLTAPTITYEPIPLEDGTFTRPTAPNAPTVGEVDATVPAAPTLGTIAVDDLPTLPGEPDFTGMAYRQPSAPTAAMPTRPADTDVPLVEITIPDAPTYTLPADPELYTLALPAIPDLNIPEFEGVRPTLALTAPEEGLNWTYDGHDESEINAIRASLSSMRINGLALPAAIEQAIFDRARGREDVLALQQEREAERLAASRGLRQSAGLLNKIVQDIRDKARIASAGASRDIGIEIARQNVEAIRFAITQGTALESALLQQHVAIQGLLLDAAKAAHAALIDVFNGQVALHNAQWEGFKVEASVYESKIRALSAQADVLKTRIEAEKVKGDVNEGLVRAFAEKVRSLSALADMHRAQVEAAKAKGEINVQRLEQARIRLQSYGIDVDAWAKQWDAYKAQVDAEANGVRYYEAMANVYGSRVQAVRAVGEIQNDRTRNQIAAQGQQIEVFRATLDGIRTRVAAQSANVDAAVKVFQAKTSLFGTEGQVSAAESAAGDRTAQLKMEQSRLLFDGAVQSAKLAADFGIKKAELAIEGSRGAAQVWGQLAASVMSGVNLSASSGYSESTSFNYSGEI